MIFEETPLKGAYLVYPEKREDPRGFFARTWCRHEFEEHGLVTDIAQTSISLSRRKGTLRGLHYQVHPAAETKLIRCTRGAIYDVIVDLRAEAPSFKRWFGIELTAENCTMCYVPTGFAHGFQTLTDDAEVCYQISPFYSPEHQRGARYDDPAFRIEWPVEITTISDKDRSWPDYPLSDPPQVERLL